jgi:L-glyceraldehyde 3-phosphate reductase
MLNRWIEEGLLALLCSEGIGCVAFSPLAQGLLTGKYLDGVPATSRAAAGGTFARSMLSVSNLERVRGLAAIASARGQTLAQLALAWAARHPEVTTLLLGANNLAQLKENLGAVQNLELSDDELVEIDRYAVDADINIWQPKEAR